MKNHSTQPDTTATPLWWAPPAILDGADIIVADVDALMPQVQALAARVAAWVEQADAAARKADAAAEAVCTPAQWHDACDGVSSFIGTVLRFPAVWDAVDRIIDPLTEARDGKAASDD